MVKLSTRLTLHPPFWSQPAEDGFCIVTYSFVPGKNVRLTRYPLEYVKHMRKRHLERT